MPGYIQGSMEKWIKGTRLQGSDCKSSPPVAIQRPPHVNINNTGTWLAIKPLLTCKNNIHSEHGSR